MLINPTSRIQVYQSLAENLSAVEPPVWAGLMATYVRNKGLWRRDHRCRGRGAHARRKRPSVAATSSPKLVAVVVYGQQPSASTQIMPAAGDVCAGDQGTGSRAEGAPAGGHVAALPERTLREEAADFVAGGEGLVTLTELVAALKAGDTDLGKVPGLYYRDGQHVVPTAEAGGPGAGSRPGDARHRLGLAAHGQVPRPQLALPGQ